MTTTRSETRTRRPSPRRAAVALPMAFALVVSVAACGGDDDDEATVTTDPVTTEPATTEPETTEPVTTEPVTPEPEAESETTEPETTGPAPVAEGASAEFCDAFVGVERAFAAAPMDDPDAMTAYVEAEVLPRIETIRANLPAAVADEVTVMVDATEALATTGDFSAMESLEFFEAQAAVYPWLGEGCDMSVIEVAAVDFAFGGVPTETEAGPTIFTLVNESETGEAHEMAFARINDDVDMTVDELLALPMGEVEQYVQIGGGTYAPAGASSSTIVDLTPGRWVYICFIPVGSVDGAEGSGPPHFMEGMVGELIVG